MLKKLRRILQEINRAQDFREALDIMVKSVAQGLQTDACSVFLFDKKQLDYVLLATQGLNPQAINQVRIPKNKGLIGLVGEREEPINLENAQSHASFLSIPVVQEESYKAFLGAPIIHHRKVLGVIIVQQQETRRFDEAEEAFLITLAAQLASIIAHADSTGEVASLFNRHKSTQEAFLSAIPGSPGIGFGTAHVISPGFDLDAVLDSTATDIEAEIELLQTALTRAQEDFREFAHKLDQDLPPEEKSLFAAYQRILAPDNLGEEIITRIRAGQWAQGALRQVAQAHIKRIGRLENEYLRERALDIKNLAQRVLMYLQRQTHLPKEYSKRTILVGAHLSVADLAEVPRGYLAGIISGQGTRNSHLAILARALGIPTLMGLNEVDLATLHNRELILDGFHGHVFVDPNEALRTKFVSLCEKDLQLDLELEKLHHLPAETLDGKKVSLQVNTGLSPDVSLALTVGAEGVGLYRSEAPFLLRDRFPSSEEQRIIYRQLLTSFHPHPVAMRTLDIGGDKSLPYFPVNEENPFLGWRGIRITLDHPEIFLAQVRAMLRASEGLENLQIMLPMITDVSEVDEAISLINKAHKELINEGWAITFPPVGVMVEVPSAVYQARALAQRADFISIGSNDLTQYILAVDRNNVRVANLFNPLHPAVLQAMISVVNDAHLEGKKVSICGEMAADPASVILLLGMGVDVLSMSAKSLARVKWIIRNFKVAQAQQILIEVLTMESPTKIRAHLDRALKDAGLYALVQHS